MRPKRKKGSNNCEVQSKLTIQFHLHLLREESAVFASGFGQCRYKVSLEYFVVPEKKKELKNDRVMKQRHKNWLEGVPNGEIWDRFCTVGNLVHT